MLPYMIRAAEIRPGDEFIAHTHEADEDFRQPLMALESPHGDTDGMTLIDVFDQAGRTGTLKLLPDTACTVYPIV